MSTPADWPTRPAPGRVRPYEFPDAHRTTLANGLRVVVAPMPRLPIVTVLAVVDAGATADAPGREGEALLTARTLLEGTGTLDGAALTDRLEGLGTTLIGTADWDSSSLRFTVTTSRLAEAFPLFAEVLCAPSFPAADVGRRRDERLAEIAQELAEPRGLADLRFSGFLYASEARFARALDGTQRSVRALGADTVRDFHASHYAPARTTLYFVGDIAPEHANEVAERGFGGWRVAVSPGVTVRPSATRGARRTVLVDKKGAPQTELRVGHAGVPRTHPDHLAIVVMNAILGGLFSSRINLNLREKHAFTYGASSTFDWRRNAGPFVVSTAVKTEVTERALGEILREIDGMRASPPRQDEVELATEYLAGVFPIRYETTAAVAGALAAATLFDLPSDWFSGYRSRVRAITPAIVHAVAREHLHPGDLLALAVGDAALIEGPLGQLGMGTLTRHANQYDPSEDA